MVSFLKEKEVLLWYVKSFTKGKIKKNVIKKIILLLEIMNIGSSRFLAHDYIVSCIII
jgi:hypothetical protein